jgi:hypothetical protein
MPDASEPPAPTPNPIPRSKQVDPPVTPGPTSIPVIKFNPDTSSNYRTYFSNSANLQPKNRQKVFKDLASSSSSSVSVINMPLPPITVGNTNPGSIPAPSGNPTPLPFISPINLLYEEAMALNAVNLGILA